MKLYAVLNQRNQVVQQANLLELTHFCKKSDDHLNIATFRPGESHGRIVASFNAGEKSQSHVGVSVSQDVLGRFNG